MIPKFNPQEIKVDYVLPTKLENDRELRMYREYIVHIVQGEGMGSVTKTDVALLYSLFEHSDRFTKEQVKETCSLFEHVASAEAFESVELARECLSRIDSYRTEYDI